MQLSTRLFAGVATIAMAAVAPLQAAWTTPVLLSGVVERYEVDATVAADAAGNVHLIFQDFKDADCRLYYMNNMSGSWSAREQVGSSNGKGSIPLILITPDGMLHVLYGKTNLYWRTKPVVGGAWSNPVEVALSPQGGFTNHAVVDSSGGIYFMWGHLFDENWSPRNGVYGRYKPLGGSWGSTETIAGGGNDSQWHRGDSLYADGTTIWAFISYGGSTYMKKRPVTGIWPSGNGTFFCSGGGVRIAKSPTANEMAASYVYDTGGSPWYEVVVKYSSDGGNTWGSEYNVSNTNGLDRMQEMVYDASGNLHFVWQGEGCTDCGLRVMARSRTSGTWGSRSEITPAQGGLVINSLTAFANTLHLGLSRNTNWWDTYYATNVLAPPPPTAPVLHPLTLSNNPLIADDTIQHTITLQASDVNGVSDIRSLRFMVNFQGTNAGAYRGYVSWGQSAADITKYDGAANWSVSPVNSGSGYWGIHTTSWGKADYLTIRSVSESTYGHMRTVNITFSVKPKFYADGPLTNNDISVYADDAGLNTGWQNTDINFGVLASNAVPTVSSLTLNSGMLLPDDTTQYTVAEQVSDADGVADIRSCRWLINYQGGNAGAYRGYLAWGQTESDIAVYGGMSAWQIQPVNGGSGYWGIRMNGYGNADYITPRSVYESSSGNTRTVQFNFTAKPLYLAAGPLTGNDISAMAQDTYTSTVWQNFDLNFQIYPQSLSIPDFDRDIDVDIDDFAYLQKCLSGTNISQTDPACQAARLDIDQDVDTDDVLIFQDCMSGPNLTPVANCAQ